jgi:hypothetical protein
MVALERASLLCDESLCNFGLLANLECGGSPPL